MIAAAAFCSAWLVMICLGARQAPAVATVPLLGRSTVLRHLFGVYVLPLLLLGFLFHLGYLLPMPLVGMALCVTAGSGTSGAALVAMAGGHVQRAAAVLLATTLASIVLMPLTLVLLAGQTDWLGVGLRAALVCLLFQLLPFVLGRFWVIDQAWWPRWQRRVERLANLAVTLLILLVVLQQLPQVVQQPLLLGIGSLLALAFWWGSRISGAAGRSGEQLELMAVVRNLTGVLVVLPALPQSAAALQAIPAFGLPMYVLCALLVWRARRSRPAPGRAPMDATP